MLDTIIDKVAQWLTNRLGASFRTTALGVCLIVGAVANYGSGLLDTTPGHARPSLAVTLVAITTGIGLIHARDDRVTSEQSGASSSASAAGTSPTPTTDKPVGMGNTHIGHNVNEDEFAT